MIKRQDAKDLADAINNNYLNPKEKFTLLITKIIFFGIIIVMFSYWLKEWFQ